MVAGGPQSGRLIWVKPTSPVRPRSPLPEIPTGTPSSPEAAAPSPDILAERRAKHQNRRIARMAEITRQLLQVCDGKSLSLETLLALARTFGTNQSLKGVWNFNSSSDPWADFDAFCGLSAEDAAAEIWTSQLEPVLASRLQYCGPNDAERLHGEILAALKLIGASYADLYRTVAKELPEPKAWARFPGYEPENLDGEPPAPGNLLRFEPQDDLPQDNTELEVITA
jgi:hypothetical protein